LKIPAGRYGAAYGIATRGLQHPLCADITESERRMCGRGFGHKSVSTCLPFAKICVDVASGINLTGETYGYATQHGRRHGRLAIGGPCRQSFGYQFRICSGRIHGRHNCHQRATSSSTRFNMQAWCSNGAAR
jgi:hypothetical protein